MTKEEALEIFNQQEKKVAKAIDDRQTANNWAIAFSNGV